MHPSEFRMAPQGKCEGEIHVPGDKSISHRAVILASIAEGVSELKGFLPSTDCMVTLHAFQKMGVQIEEVTSDHVKVHGAGLHGLKAPDSSLDMGNSGTAMRLMAGVLAGQNFSSILIGDESLSIRPMQRIQGPLQKFGAKLELSTSHTAPIHINPVSQLHGIHYKSTLASAQVKSCILLAGLYASGETCIDEAFKSRDHTEKMLQAFSYPLSIQNNQVCLQGGGRLQAAHIDIPGDFSSAAFFIAGTLISKNCKLIIKNVGINETRNGALEILKMMGANIDIQNKRLVGSEPIADIFVQSSKLIGINIPNSLVAKSIDEFPIVFIVAACAKGITTLRGAEELRVKESDRIHCMRLGLQKLGIHVVEHKDGLTITGGELQGGTIDSYGDHRIAMAFSMASICAKQEITIENVENVSTSFPGFLDTASHVGLNVM